MSDGQTPYDKIIYPEGAYQVAHPDRAAVVAALLGVKPPPLTTARILELGCGTGGHLIPIAYAHPGTTCVGIDYAQAQIRIARETVEAVGLTNITFHALDFMQVPDDIGEFDYIIAHGIFSWIDEPLRHRLLDIMHRHMAPNGVAYLSYNTYPGWRMLEIGAEIMRYRVRDIKDPWERVRVAREVIQQLDSLPAHANVDSDWARFMTSYHEVIGVLKDYLELKSDHVLLHDDLEETSRPFYYHEIVELLAQHDLAYLADAAFSSNLMMNLDPAEEKWVKSVGRTFDEMEQYLDILRNRTFRTSLLVHESLVFNRSITPLPIADFYLSSALQRTDPQPDGIPKGAVHFHSPEGIGFVTEDLLMIAALDLLIEEPGTQLPFRNLVRRARERIYAYSIPATTLEEDASKIATTLLQFYSKSANMVDFYSTPATYVTTLSERPIASKYARYQAISSEMVTNHRHNRVHLSANARALLGLLDGTNDRNGLIETMLRLTLQPENVPESERRAEMATEVDRLLERFRTAALLVA